MKKLQVIILLVTVFLIGLQFNKIVNYIKKDITHIMHVEYCNDLYQGRINTCPYYTSDIKQ